MHKVLIVDDEPQILDACRRALRREEYLVRVVASPREALRLIAGDRYAAVLSDQRMPEMAGIDLLERIRTLSPATVALLFTAHPDLGTAMEAINRGGVYRFFAKPWRDDELRSALRRAVTDHSFRVEREIRRHVVPSSSKAKVAPVSPFEEVALRPRELRPGMLLTRRIETPYGAAAATPGRALTPAIIAAIRRLAAAGSLVGRVYVCLRGESADGPAAYDAPEGREP